MVCCLGCFGMESGMVGYGFGVKTYLSFQFQVNKKERVFFEFEMYFKKYFGWRCNHVIEVIMTDRYVLNYG